MHAANCNALGGEPLDAVSRIDSHSRLHLYSCSCDTVHASVLSTTNAIGNDEFVEQRKRHFPRECTLLPSSSSRAFLAFFRLSSYRATIFFHPSVCLLFAPAFSRLSTLTKCLTVKRPAKSLANLPFLFFYDVFRLS